MNRLIIFGDSFVTLERRKDFSFPFWTEQLAEKLGLSLVVHGKGGTNLNWSLINYYNYIKNDYNKEDIIIFVVTSGSRLPYVHQDFDAADGVSSQFLKLGSPWKWNTKNFENELDAAKHVLRHLTHFRNFLCSISTENQVLEIEKKPHLPHQNLDAHMVVCFLKLQQKL